MDMIKYFFISELSSVTQITKTDSQLCSQVSSLQFDIDSEGTMDTRGWRLGLVFCFSVSVYLVLACFLLLLLFPDPYSTYNFPSQVPTLENIVKKLWSLAQWRETLENEERQIRIPWANISQYTFRAT